MINSFFLCYNYYGDNMRDITRINPAYVNSDGRYFNPNTMSMFNLTLEEIYYLRKYYNDDMDNPKIAKNVRIIVKTNRTPVNNSNSNYRLTREQKYNNGLYKLKKQIKRELTAFLVIGGIVVSLVGALNYFTEKSDNYIDTFEEPIFVIESNELKRDVILNVDDVNRKELIKKICDIYQVNYDVVYKVIEKITENFSSIGYLEGKIDGVSCKGEDVVAKTDEELFIYIIRVIKQDPSRWSIDTSNLYINNGYDSGDDYCNQIEYVSNVLGVDKHLMYAIVQSECGFDSQVFNELNNPGGIKNNDGNWWKFDTKEEGFLELGMEILKYYRWIGEPSSRLDEETISKIRDIHAPLSDGNIYWLSNVLSVLEYAQANSEELFGSEMQINGLLH